MQALQQAVSAGKRTSMRLSIARLMTLTSGVNMRCSCCTTSTSSCTRERGLTGGWGKHAGATQQHEQVRWDAAQAASALFAAAAALAAHAVAAARPRRPPPPPPPTHTHTHPTCWCLSALRLFMMRTMAASMACLRSLSTSSCWGQGAHKPQVWICTGRGGGRGEAVHKRGSTYIRARVDHHQACNQGMFGVQQARSGATRQAGVQQAADVRQRRDRTWTFLRSSTGGMGTCRRTDRQGTSVRTHHWAGVKGAASGGCVRANVTCTRRPLHCRPDDAP